MDNHSQLNQDLKIGLQLKSFKATLAIKAEKVKAHNNLMLIIKCKAFSRKLFTESYGRTTFTQLALKEKDEAQVRVQNQSMWTALSLMKMVS